MSRSSEVVVGAPSDDDLLLPRPPGMLRRFWARHPIFTDVLVTAIAALLALPSATAGSSPLVLSPPEAWLALALLGAGTVALLFRRRRPLLVFAIAATLSLLLPPSLAPVAHMLLSFAIYAVAAYRSARACWIAFAATVTALTAYAIPVAVTQPARGVVISHLCVAIVALLIGALLGVNVGNRRRYLQALIERSRQLLVERDQQAQLAAAAERTRIAREMHDIVSHSLTVVVALAEGATATRDRDRARAATAQVAVTARAALTEMRGMLGVLRDPAVSASAPLAPPESASYSDAVEAAQRAGYPVRLRVTGSLGPAPSGVRFAIARIVQESLTNAMRHAHATSILVTMTAAAGLFEVEVVNDGVLAPARPGGFGLQGLRERVAHVGGTLTAGPAGTAPTAPGAGGTGSWRVHARIPVAPETEEVSR